MLGSQDKADWLALAAAYFASLVTARWYVGVLNEADDAVAQDMADEASDAVRVVNAMRARCAGMAHDLMGSFHPGDSMYEALYAVHDTTDTAMENDAAGAIILSHWCADAESAVAEVSKLIESEGE